MYFRPVVYGMLLALALHAQTPVSLRVLFGTTDRTSTKWDGSVEPRGAEVSGIEPWRFEGADAIAGSTWKLSTHRIRLFGAAPPAGRPVVANGIIVHVAAHSGAALLHFQTAQGGFDVALDEVPFGASVTRLNGRVFVDRVPEHQQITRTPDEEDFPSAALDRSGNVWVAYSVFRHNPDHDRLRAPLREPLQDFAPLRSTTGGDQILARCYANGKWEDPVAITLPAGDDYRTAIAVDGRGTPWVFWSQNQDGNFDVFASAIENGRPVRRIRLSNSPGSDIDPVAATDSSGRVWVAWQSWRDGRASIQAAVQKGASFGSPMGVSKSTADEWNPAIAADARGHVTVGWDSYRNGNFDVYARTANMKGSWGSEVPVAASARYEAYPSVAYDAAGRLWVAYEEGGAGWGKDFGAYNTNGVSVYQGRAIRIRGFEPDGKRIELASDVSAVLPGIPRQKVDNPGRQSEDENLGPQPENARDRRPGAAAANLDSPRNTLPRLVADASGRLWLAFRSAHPIWWNPIGTVWSEYVASLDGTEWTRPVFLTHSDNLLDNRPALVSPRAGELLVVGSADNRRQFQLTQTTGAPVADPYNNDLYLNRIALAPARQAAAAKPGAAVTVQPSARIEADAIKVLREYRTPTPEKLRLARGEFHRHSEISMDGGRDGTLVDQWRYILDAGALDWVGCCDHDNGNGREYTWWLEQKLTDVFNSPGRFAAMFSYERSVAYPEGHRNVIFTQRGIRVLPRLPKTREQDQGNAPDTQMLYAYLRFFGGVVASHTSATNMGTDWRDNDPQLEPAVEIYQGDRQNYEMPDAPRSPNAQDALGGWRPKGFVNQALEKGYLLGFEASSDHISTHISYANLLVRDVTRDAVLDALRKRHLYAATDNILAEFRSGDHMMGDVFLTSEMPHFDVKLTGTAPFAKVYVVRNDKYVYSTEPKTKQVSFSWMDNAPLAGQRSYYYVRGEQENGELVWISPMWITYSPK